MAEVFISPEPGSDPGERFYLDVLPATTLQATNDVIEGRVVSTDALGDKKSGNYPILFPAPRYALPSPLPEGEGVNEPEVMPA